MRERTLEEEVQELRRCIPQARELLREHVLSDVTRTQALAAISFADELACHIEYPHRYLPPIGVGLNPHIVRILRSKNHPASIPMTNIVAAIKATCEQGEDGRLRLRGLYQSTSEEQLDAAKELADAVRNLLSWESVGDINGVFHARRKMQDKLDRFDTIRGG